MKIILKFLLKMFIFLFALSVCTIIGYGVWYGMGKFLSYSQTIYGNKVLAYSMGSAFVFSILFFIKHIFKFLKIIYKTRVLHFLIIISFIISLLIYYVGVPNLPISFIVITFIFSIFFLISEIVARFCQKDNTKRARNDAQIYRDYLATKRIEGIKNKLKIILNIINVLMIISSIIYVANNYL